jgi:hypothetical protein
VQPLKKSGSAFGAQAKHPFFPVQPAPASPGPASFTAVMDIGRGTHTCVSRSQIESP